MKASTSSPTERVDLRQADIPLERDVFLRTLIRHLAGTLEEVVGLNEASGFVSIVGQRMGDEINDAYKAVLNVSKLDRAQVTEVCIDLKRRIQGNFYVISEDEDKIVFGNSACPFNEKVLGRPALCMMTSNVFGTIAAENLGYGKVQLEKTIARGDAGCTVVLYIRRTPEADAVDGREYVRSE
jgi:predicted ArsR family transcriptional regulator